MQRNFKNALAFVMAHECVFARGHSGDMSYVIPENVSGDRGGLTKFGIDQRSHPHVNIKALDYSQATEIYRREYWARVRADELPAGYDLAMFDIAVNNGPGKAALILQRALNNAGAVPSLAEDGFIGPRTIAAATKMGEKGLEFVFIAREQLYHDLAEHPVNKKFLRGWLNRNHDLQRAVAHQLETTGTAAA